MRLSAASDIGKVRANNEDNYALGELENAAFAIVCDGMGGVQGGEIASKIAVETIQKQIELSYSPKMKAAAVQRMLICAFTAANMKVYEYALEHALEGMGTTAVAAILREDCLYIAYDGDSRAYIINDSIRQITTDHTYLNELFRLGKISEEQMRNDARKNIITRALGVAQEIEVDVLEEDFSENDLLLLCTDGLTNCLNDQQILEICKTRDFEKRADLFIQKANENGGIDNITVALIANGEA